MAVGFPVTQNTVDNRLGTVALQLRNLLASDIPNLQAFFDRTSDSDLLALGYVQADVDQARAIINAFSKLARIAFAQDTQPAASNFFFDAVKIIGPN